MKADDADLILRQLKKGQIGLAYWSLGFVLAGSIAGGLYTKYYPDKKRDDDTKKADELNMFGIDVPKNAQHNSQLQSLQMGATYSRIHEHYMDDKDAGGLTSFFAGAAGTGWRCVRVCSYC